MGAPSRLLIDLEPEARPGAVAVTGTATRMDTDMSPVPHG
jgi:hypothetical protein